MSAFLGPIHFWLYDKIKIQNEIVEEILDYAEKNNENIRSELYAKFGDGDLKPLSEVIDVTNIHGWLQERVARVERKLAYLVPKLIDNTPTSGDLAFSSNSLLSDVHKAASDKPSLFDNWDNKSALTFKVI